MRWPESAQVMRQVQGWAQEQAHRVPSLGSDLDLLLIDTAASGPQQDRLRRWPLELLPLCCDALVLTPGEHEALMAEGSRFAGELRRDARWVWGRTLNP